MNAADDKGDGAHELDELTEQIKLWRRRALQDAEGIDDGTLADYISGRLDAKDRRDLEAKLAESPDLQEIVDAVSEVVTSGQWDQDQKVPPRETQPPVLSPSEKVTTTRLQRVLALRTNFWLTTGASLAVAICTIGVMATAFQATRARAVAYRAQAASRMAVSQRSRALNRRNMSGSVLAFSPDGSLLATGSQDGAIRLWSQDANTSQWNYLNENSQAFNTEAYDRIYENAFLLARDNPLSTFSIDVDTASYSNTRRFLNQGKLPPKDAVRVEELINYFSYEYEPPQGDEPFSVDVEVAACPWQPNHKLARIGLKGKVIPAEKRQNVNLIFLIDVSGSMKPDNKLPLLRSSMAMLVGQLQDSDRVAMVVYAGASGLVLPPTACAEREAVLAALDRLQAGGSTAGSEGIELAYQVAEECFDPECVNRVILCTDGDFNVGITDQGQLIRLIEKKAKSGVFLSVLGFGMGNYQDSTLEKLADKGNGNYAYIDTALEAQKVLVDQLQGTLVTIAKDVKIQVDFNPKHVGAYRLIGYENRMLQAEDFRDDTKDAGEIGAGHSVTALYQLVPAELTQEAPSTVASKYLGPGELSAAAMSDELLTIGLRYKSPIESSSRELSVSVTTEQMADHGSPDFQFAAAVGCFGMLLRDSGHRGLGTFDLVLELADEGKGDDPNGYRGEFIQLVKTASSIPMRESP